MSDKSNVKSLAAAIGAVVIGSVATIPAANADQNPFGMTQLSSGYMVAGMAEGKCGGKKMEEGKCGGKKMEGAAEKKMEGKCGEGKCGANKKKMEGKCGEGKCGANKKMMEGEGKCGANKK